MTFVATDEDRAHLRRALELAEGGRGRVSPNPLVGAVIVRDGETIGEGFHAALGERHAEVTALADCRERGHEPAGATIYVTLEPCAHQGRQPPCTDAILAAGIARVRDRLRRPEREGLRTRARDPPRRGGRGRVRRRRRGRGRPAARAAVPQARPHRPAAGHPEVGDQPRRVHGDPERRFALDLRSGEPGARPSLARRGGRGRRRDRDGTGRRPAADRARRRRPRRSAAVQGRLRLRGPAPGRFGPGPLDRGGAAVRFPRGRRRR